MLHFLFRFVKKYQIEFEDLLIYFFSEEKKIIAKFDRTQLIRVITNLVKNSIQSIREFNPKQAKIEVSVFSEDNFAAIVVKDNGLGISDENKIKVFEPKFIEMLFFLLMRSTIKKIRLRIIKTTEIRIRTLLWFEG